MHYQQYLLLLSRTSFTYFVHKIGKSNSVMVAASWRGGGGGNGINSLFITTKHIH